MKQFRNEVEITSKMANLKVQVKAWNKSENRDEELELDILDTVREVMEAVEADENFTAPEECRDADGSDPAYQCAIAAHAEELADTLNDSENKLALRVLASHIKNIAYISGLTPALDLTELAWAFDAD